ncbi:hypothetical protein RBU60_13735 [Mesonia sp. MT50]|uniref:YARHG domain-containing protein n=1 Tax=Mesonia profundi TaxID=3070998 RepID=A0ABU1A4K7_9FLAO|nr:hypothetical protein [Mesonia profundi]MDQ7918635.1 hypothetical protein [Mesonia profundi]
MENFSLKIIFLFAILFISRDVNAQTKLYLDQNGEKISLQEFKKRCNSSYLYNCLSFKKDSIVFSQIFYKHQFGKISPQEYEQVRKLINKDSDFAIEPNQIIVIKKHDNLLS